jgi:UrcA family protein
MKNKPIILAAVAGLLLVNNPSFGQGNSANAVPREEVVVTAPYLVEERTAMDKAKAGKLHAPVLSIRMEQIVSYSDLDLTKLSDADVLEKRVRDAANAVCKKLDKQYPPAVYIPITTQTNCIESASTEGMAAALAIIAVSNLH